MGKLQKLAEVRGHSVTNAADFTVLSFFDRPDFRRFLVTKVRRLHIVCGFAPFKSLLTLLTLFPGVLHPVVVFVLSVVGDGLFTFLLCFSRSVIFYRIDRLERGGEIFISWRSFLLGLSIQFI